MDLLCCKHGLTGSPRFYTTFRQSSRDIVNILEGIVHCYIAGITDSGNAVTDALFEFLLDILPDNKYHMVETSLNRIMNGIVHDDVFRSGYRLQLLVPVPKRLPIPAAMIRKLFSLYSPCAIFCSTALTDSPLTYTDLFFLSSRFIKF